MCALIGSTYFLGGSHPARQASVQDDAGPDENLYTGSILFISRRGDCRQHLFDNLTGQIQDKGLVDCDDAAYGAAGRRAMKWSVARTDVIRAGFRK
jgi:hypothetical protein